MSKDLVVLGGGGHARVVIQAAQSRGEWNVVGYVDPSKRDATRLGVRYLGEDAAKIAGDPAFSNCRFVLGIGSTFEARARREIAKQSRVPAGRWATVVHDRAIVSPSASIGAGTV